jgi:hypothetical protein
MAKEKTAAEEQEAVERRAEPQIDLDQLQEADETMPALPAVTEEADVFRRMELEDERQILDELQGRALDVMIYSFESGGRVQTGFSWKGAREAVRTLNARGWTRIAMDSTIEPKFEETTDAEGQPAVRCVVYARDDRNGGGNWGVAIQPKKYKPRSGNEKKPDPFYTHKALSKAQRNAYEPLIPLEAVEYLKAQYLGRPDAVKVIPGAGRAVEIDAPTPLDTPEAKEVIAKMRLVHEEIKAIDRLVMPPGQFNAIVQGSQHDLDRLEDALAHLVSFRDGEAEIDRLREVYRQGVSKEDFEREAGKVVGMSQQRRLARWRDLAGKEE